jgi:hypothetical protein
LQESKQDAERLKEMEQDQAPPLQVALSDSNASISDAAYDDYYTYTYYYSPSRRHFDPDHPAIVV